MPISKYRLAKQVGLTPTHVINILNSKDYASLEKAVEIEIATGGKYKVEDLVRPEVAEALRKFLTLRCPILQKLTPLPQGESVKEEKKTTVEVDKCI